ncbi:MAG: MYXO-CTERM domain-containing protein, partial [Phycisphaerales bacterium]|nr:MYXO-CTERM domain-containing protein [Phycisphaerales bacterium]
VGQFTTWGYGSASAPWGQLNLSGYSTSFMPGGGLVEWSADGVTFGVPTPGALALLGLAGFVRRRRRAD